MQEIDAEIIARLDRVRVTLFRIVMYVSFARGAGGYVAAASAPAAASATASA